MVESIEISCDRFRVSTDAWADYVMSHPYGSVFQTPEMFEVYSHTSGNEPLVVFALRQSKLVGLLVASIMQNGIGPIHLLTRRSVVVGGPLVLDDDPMVTGQLIHAYDRIVSSRFCIYSQFRPIYDMGHIFPYLVASGYLLKPHLNLTLDLSTSYGDLYSNLHNEKKRNIRKAEEAGLIFKELFSEKEIESVCSLIRKTYARKGVPMNYLGIFNEARNSLKDYVHFFGAFDKEHMIAAQVRLCYKDLVYAWFAGSDERYLKMKPNDFLLWNVITWSYDRKFKCFDFGGGGEPGVPYGVRDYKLKFGCKVHDWGRLEKYYRPLTYHLASLLYRLFHRIKGK